MPPVIVPVALSVDTPVIALEPMVTPEVRRLAPVTLPATLRADPDVLAMVTEVAVLNVAVPVPATGPTAIVVVDPAAPDSPMLTVLRLPDAVTPLARTNDCVSVDLPMLITPV